MVSRVFKEGKILTSNAFFSCLFVSNPDGVNIAVVAPKTAFKTATARNNVRRKWYASLPRDLTKLKLGIYVLVLKNARLQPSPEDRRKSFLFLNK